MLKLIRITKIFFHIWTVNDTYTIISVTTASTKPFAKQGLIVYKSNAALCYILIKSLGSLNSASQIVCPAFTIWHSLTVPRPPVSLWDYCHLILWKTSRKQNTFLSPSCIPFPLTRAVSSFEVWFTGAIEPLCWLHVSLQGN